MVDFLKDLWGFLRTRKKFWLFPVIFLLLLLALIVVLSASTTIAPFIYTF